MPVSGQTYSRKVDAFILNALAGIGQSCMKFATDLRLLANFKEMEEPFEKNQIGSSAMPYKRNPMRCERICALSRYLMVDVLNPSFTTGTQWFERTLDDSANKRVAMAEGFLATDAILNIMLNVTDGIVVYPKVVRSRLMAELPFMASENIMMQAVEKGGNRQELHERLRQHAIAAGKQVKEEGLPNDMVDRIAADPAFGLTREEIVAGLVPENFVGRAPQQVEEFIANVLKPIFDANPDVAKLAHFAKEYKDMPCMAYTHCQPAQPTTVGKRATLWANELVMDLAEIDHRLATLQLRGVKGTTGTQASFMELFKGDADKIRAVDASIAKEMGFDPKAVVPVSGQTYSRKVDAFILNALAGIGQSCMKFATDLRLLANFKEMEEPFEKNQIGSSAMPYKRNPMRCERICALARYLMVDVLNPSFTTGTQWFERTLDDSANKRVAMAEGFLATDAILNIMLNVTDGLVVYPKVVRSRLMAELPFMASENIMMQAVEKGGNRQELHERLRQHAIAAGKQVKEEGLPNDMVDRIAADPAFGLTREEIVAGLVPENFVGRAPQQVEEFIANVLQPIFDADPEDVEQHASLSV